MEARGIELHLFRGAESGSDPRGGVGRKTISRENTFPLRDYKIGSFTLRLACGYLQAIRDLRPDLVVCPAHPGNLGHWRLGGLRGDLGFKLVSWQCGYEYNPGTFKRIITRRFVPRFDYHLAYHSNAKRYALDNGAAERQVQVTHNTINEAKISCLSKADAVQQINAKHPEIAGRKILLYVGAVLAEKRIELLFDAMAKLDRKDAVLVVVGAGPHLAALRDIARGRKDILFFGAIVDGVGLYFDSAEVYLLPGTGGLGINEAMAHSLPIISGYADGSADDLVVTGENGFRLNSVTADEIAERIRWLLDNPDGARAMGAKSREWITGRFSFSSFLDRIETSLAGLLG